MPRPTLPATAGAADVSPRPCLPPPASIPAPTLEQYGTIESRLADAARLVLARQTPRTLHMLQSAVDAWDRRESEQVQRARIEAARLARIGGLRG